MIRKSAVAIAIVLVAALQAQAPNRPAFTPTVRVDKNVEIPMRDGVGLATDIYYPDGPGPFPVVVMLHGGKYGKAATLGLGRAMRSPTARS